MRSLLFCATMIALASAGSVAQEKKPSNTFTSAAEAGPDFMIQGEYVGDTVEKARLAAQVVARGDGNFDIYFLAGGLPGDGWDAKTRTKVAARTVDGKITLADPWRGEFTEGGLTGKTGDGIDFVLKRTERRSPTLGAKPPEGAVILFDGSNTEHWNNGKLVEDNLLNNGTSSKTGFALGKLHLEFRTPFMPRAGGQGRGNSGVYVLGKEIQVLDSFGLEGKNNECGGFYGARQPAVNMCLPPLSWQTYDVEARAGDKDTVLVTVWHNGVKIHEDFAIKTQPGSAKSINLQNHGNPVVYRNIWFVPAEPPQ